MSSSQRATGLVVGRLTWFNREPPFGPLRRCLSLGRIRLTINLPASRLPYEPDNLDRTATPTSGLYGAIGYERENWDIRLWGRNLGDEDYRIRGFYFPQDPRDNYTERGWFQFGEPRRYGVTLNLKI